MDSGISGYSESELCTRLVGDDELGEYVVVALAGEMLLEPGLVTFVEGEVPFGRINDLGAGIDFGFGRVGFD